MNVFLFAPINNEIDCLRLQIEEGQSWIDQIHVTEINQDFQGRFKEFSNFDISSENLYYHKSEAKGLLQSGYLQKRFGVFDSNRKTYSNRIRNRLGLIGMSWYNEAVQRNKACDYKSLVSDKDIVILSDIDEIIDSRYANEIVDLIKKHEIITIKLHFTLFYFNLFSVDWGGPPDYSYRMFGMTGKHFKNINISSDYLRKEGEAGELLNRIYCPDKIMGFHHSWLGDEKFISKKLLSYAHIEHSSLNNIDYIRKCISERKSLFPGHQLQIDNDIRLLKSVEALRATKPQYFIQ